MQQTPQAKHRSEAENKTAHGGQSLRVPVACTGRYMYLHMQLMMPQKQSTPQRHKPATG
jgi:hypothetical protein